MWLRRIALVAASTLVAVGLAELAVRIAMPDARAHAVPSGFFRIDPLLGWSIVPGRTSRHRTFYSDVELRINAAGYRDRERDPRSVPPERRVLVFGDSQIFGWGVEVSRRWTDRVESSLPGLEVWNFGVPGYGLDQALLAYERDAAAIPAGTVVLYVSNHELTRSLRATSFRKPKPLFVIQPEGGLRLEPPDTTERFWTSLAYRAFSWMALPYAVERGLRELRTHTPTDVTTGATLGAAILERAERLTRERGQRLVLLDGLREAMHPWLRQVAERLGLEVWPIDFPGEQADWYLGPRDGHWNPRAHAYIADGVAARLADLAVAPAFPNASAPAAAPP